MKSKQAQFVINSHNFYKDKIESMGLDSYCGRGSCTDTTEDIVENLPIIIEKFKIKSIIDSPCGDWNWMKRINIEDIDYIGLDIIDDVLEMNRSKYGNDKVKFKSVDLLNDNFDYKSDLIICRDFLFHIDTENVINLLNKFKASGSKYLLSTSFEYINENIDINQSDNGYGFRKINLLKEPFNLKNPIFGFIEKHPENMGRGMYLWEIN
jgi:energy-converting hydrogenase A subunit M